MALPGKKTGQTSLVVLTLASAFAGPESHAASSRRQLQRAFAEVGRTTFREHLAKVRMTRVAELLAAGSLPVREVAQRVGYRQPAQSAKAFRRHIGGRTVRLPGPPRRSRRRSRTGRLNAPPHLIVVPLRGEIGCRGHAVR